MNYLAHLYLGGNAPESMIGAMMGDFVKGSVGDGLPPAISEGIRLHRRIDTFTDAHPTFRTSKRRIAPEYRRYAGILIDVFYDHFLACDWSAYSPVPLDHFARRVYHVMSLHQQGFPPRMQRSTAYMIATVLLVSYRDIEGIRTALRGIEGRLRRPSQLGLAIAELESNYAQLHADFSEFFPALMQFVADSDEHPVAAGTGRRLVR